MAARKLLYFDPICEDPCKPITNKSGICPPGCSDSCPKVCNKTEISYTYPSPPPLSSEIDYEGHDLPLGKKHHGITQVLTISLVVVSVIVFLLACYSVYKFCNDRYNLRQRRRNLNLLVEEQQPGRDEFLDEEQGPNQAVEHHIWYIRTIGLDPAVISKIDVVKYKKGEGLIEGTDCSVCLSEFEEGEDLRLLPKCNHAFHLPCIDTWLTAHTNCPLCRAGVVSNSAVLASDEQHHDAGLVEEEIRAEISVGMDEVVEADEVVVGVEDGEVDSNAQVAVRRSVSMDAISASRLALAVNNVRASAAAGQSDDDDHVGEVKELGDGVIVPKGNGINQRLLKLVGSFSIDRPACIKRSLSCNANV